MSPSIADAIYQELDKKAHENFLWYAGREIQRYYDHAPRIDTGENWPHLELLINAYLPVYAEEANWPLRPIEIRLDNVGRIIAWLPPPPPVT